MRASQRGPRRDPSAHRPADTPENSLAATAGSPDASFCEQKNNSTAKLTSQEGTTEEMHFGQRVERDQICTFAPSGAARWVPHR